MPPVGSSERCVQSLAPVADDILLDATARDAPCKHCISNTTVRTRQSLTEHAVHPISWYVVRESIKDAFQTAPTSYTLKGRATGRRGTLLV